MTEPENNWMPFVEIMNAAALKRVARGLGGPSNMRKADCIQYVADFLQSPERIAEHLRSRSAEELMALSLLKWLGRGVREGALGLAWAAAGAPIKPPRGSGAALDRALGALYERGVLLGNGALQDFGYSAETSREVMVDDRIMEHVGELQLVPIELPAVSAPETCLVRRPPAVLLTIEDFLGAIERMGGVGLTKDGHVRVADHRKLAKAMGWENEQSFGAHEMLWPVGGLLGAMHKGGLLQCTDKKLEVAPSGGEPPAQRVARLAMGFSRHGEWTEQEVPQDSYWFTLDPRLPDMRLVLLVALRAVANPDEFHLFSDFEQALFDRIGEHFSFAGVSPPPDPRRFPGAEPVEQWRQGLRTAWVRRERKWVARALGTWLHLLGMVELGMEGEELVAFRITELGRQALGVDPAPEAAAAGEAPAWVVQPNFDVVLWLEHAGPEQMAFMARYAKRTAVRDHTAHYTLTREALHAGLQNGGTVEEFLTGLAAGSQAELPQNVLIEVREWGESLERLVLHRRARLVEYDNAAQRDAAMSGGVPGTAVGDKYILIHPTPATGEQLCCILGHRRMRWQRYDQTPARSVRAADDGVLRLDTRCPDILAVSLMDRWGDRLPDGTWRLTEQSVRRAVASKADARELQQFLSTKLLREAPALLALAVRTWTGSEVEVGSQRVMLLQCDSRQQAHTLLRDKTISDGVVWLISDNILAVHEDAAAAVLARLEWAKVSVKTLPRPPKLPNRAE